MELLNEVKGRMDAEGISIEQLVTITTLSRSTIKRFLGDGKGSKKTEEKLQSFVEYGGKYYMNESMINIGQVRLPEEHHEYLKRFAERQNISVVDVLRKSIEDIVENDYLWKSLNEHVTITEMVIKKVIQNYIIPFFKTQDKVLDEIQANVDWIDNIIMYRLLPASTEEERQQFLQMREDYKKHWHEKKYRKDV